MKVVAPWISTVAMNLWMVGHLPKNKREGGGPRCTWICGKHSLALHFCNWRARRGSSAFRHTLKGLPPAPWTKEVHLFQNSAPDPWRLGLVSVHHIFQETVTALIPRRTQLVFGLRFCDRIQQVTWVGTFGLLECRLIREVVYSVCTE